MAEYIDLREYEKFNQKKSITVLSFPNIIFEANKIYWLAVLPKGALITAINSLNISTNTMTDAQAADLTKVKIGDINNPTAAKDIKVGLRFPNGGDLMVIPGGAEFNRYFIIMYIELNTSKNTYAG